MRKRKLPDGMTTRPDRRGYYADFCVGGRRIQKKLGTDFDTARSILTDLRARAEKADYGLVDNNYPLADLQRQYLNSSRQQLQPATVRCYQAWLDTIIPRLGALKVSQLTVPAVLGYRERRLSQGRSPRTVNAEVGALATMLNWGVKPAKVIGSNPLLGIEPLPHDRPKEGRPLTDAEVERLLAASPPHWRDIWYAFLVTGLRKSELAGLQFTNQFLDWESREIIIPEWLSKNGVRRRIPMDDGLYALLRRMEANRTGRTEGKSLGRHADQVRARFTRDHIFVTTENTPLDHKGNLWRTFVGCLKRAGIERQTFDSEGRVTEHVDVHSLRRTFATSLIVSGADPKSVQELLGHKTLAMTMKIYTKVRVQTKRQALGRLPYGAGVQTPEHVVPIPSKTVQFCERIATSNETAAKSNAV